MKNITINGLSIGLATILLTGASSAAAGEVQGEMDWIVGSIAERLTPDPDFCYRVEDGCDDTRVQLYDGINEDGPAFAWSRYLLGPDDLFDGEIKPVRDDNFCYLVQDGCEDTRIQLNVGIDDYGLDISGNPLSLDPDEVCPRFAPCIPVGYLFGPHVGEGEHTYDWIWHTPEPIDAAEFAELVKEQARRNGYFFDEHDCDYTRSDCGQLNGLSSNANPFWVNNGAVLNEYSSEPAGSEEIEAFGTADISWEEIKNWRELLDVEREGVQSSEYKHVASMTAQTVAIGFLLPAELVYATVKTATGNVEEGAAAFQQMAEHTMQALNGLADQERRHREEQQRREEEIRVQQEMLDAMEIERVTRHEPLPDDVANGHHDGISEDGRSIQLRAEQQSLDELPS